MFTEAERIFYMRLISSGDIKALLSSRPKSSHKGTFGTVNAVVGCSRFRGAAALSTMGALRVGAGIVRLCSTERVCAAVTVQYPSATLLPLPETDEGYVSSSAVSTVLGAIKDGDVLLLGCGLGQCPDTAALVNGLIFGSKAKKVIDADALNLLVATGATDEAEKTGALLGCIVTPHVGEMARLTGKSPDAIAANVDSMIDAAACFSRKYKCITVLKSHFTVIAAPDDIGASAPDFEVHISNQIKRVRNKGISECTDFDELKYASKHYQQREIKRKNSDGVRIYVLRACNSGLAKGGSGDVLSGMISGFLAQGYTAEKSALLGALIHSAAAAECASELSPYAMLPSDLGEYICRVFRG